MGQVAVGITCGNDLPLFGQAETSAYGARRLRPDCPVSRTATTRDRPAAPVEKHQAHPMFVANACDAFLRLVKRPVGCQVAVLFVAVRVADHNHLFVAALAQVLAVDIGREQICQNCWRPFQIIARLE